MILRTVGGILTVRILLAIMVKPVENTLYTQPYTPDSDGTCRNKTAEYYNTDVNLCCSKCTSGKVLENGRTEMITVNYTFMPLQGHGGKLNAALPQTRRVNHVLVANKGLQYVQKCSRTTKTQCACKTGMYCVLDQHPECQECASYTRCKPGHGVSVEDAVCGPKVSGPLVCIFQTTTPPSPPTTMPPSGTGHTTPSLQSMHMSTLPTNLGSKLTSSPSEPLAIAPTEEKPPGFDLGIVAGAIGGVMFLLLIIGTIIYKKAFTKSIRVSSTEDINGNSEKEAIKFDCDRPMVLQNRSFNTTYQEQRCLLGKGDCSNVSQAETQQEASRTCSGSGCFNSLEGLPIGPAQSTLPQPSIQASTPQPSPQSTSSLASIPLVNVNITVTYPVNIGNGLCSTPTSTHIDLPQADPVAHLSREEEVYVNMPQQEGSKEARTAVQEIGNDV
ncbi:unnamed protein product [Coregonus sp. 'balchen']|nr:unnamed protein product [Coregonus sp. 'balchen']